MSHFVLSHNSPLIPNAEQSHESSDPYVSVDLVRHFVRTTRSSPCTGTHADFSPSALNDVRAALDYQCIWCVWQIQRTNWHVAMFPLEWLITNVQTKINAISNNVFAADRLLPENNLRFTSQPYGLVLMANGHWHTHTVANLMRIARCVETFAIVITCLLDQNPKPLVRQPFVPVRCEIISTLSIATISPLLSVCYRWCEENCVVVASLRQFARFQMFIIFCFLVKQCIRVVADRCADVGVGELCLYYVWLRIVAILHF